MSNPHGTDGDDPVHPDETADPVTEVIAIGGAIGKQVGGHGTDEAAEEERRYTAPGFDAGSTQIIDRVPDAPTEFITTPTHSLAGSGPHPRAAAPQAIAPRGTQRPRWLTPAIVIGVAVMAAAVLGTVIFQRSSAARASQQDRVRTTIETFDNAIRQGDLATLRSITCGQTRDSYVNYDDRSWSDTYSKVLAAKQYPVVASIDEVVVNGDQAEANVTSYMAYDPEMRSTRSFDLQFRDDQWKICQSS
jgi:hypothetical protein